MNGRQRGRVAPGLSEVVAKSARAGVVALVAQLFAHRHDGVFHLGRGAIDRDYRSAPSRHEGLFATFAVEGDVTVHPRLRASGRGRHGAHRAPFNEHRGDSVLGQIHGHLRVEVSQKP